MARETLVKVPQYLKWRGPQEDRAYWEPTAEMRAAGFVNTRLRGSVVEIHAAANVLNARWIAMKQSEGAEAAAIPETVAWWRRKYTGHINAHGKVTRDPSIKYGKLGKRTKADYTYYLNFFDKKFGAYQIRQLSPKVIKTYYEATCQKRGDNFGYHLMIAIRAFLSWCVSEDGFGKDGSNPALRVSVSTPPAREQMWSPEAVDTFCEAALKRNRRSMMLAVKIAEWTVLRPTDVRKVKWENYIGGKLVGIRTGKKKKLVPPIPLSPELIRLIDATPRNHITFMIISEGTGQEYTEVNFTRVFAETRLAGGLPKELQFKDLRRTGITEGFDAGGTNEEGRSLSTHANASSMSPYAVQTEAKVKTLMEKRLRHREKRGNKGAEP